MKSTKSEKKITEQCGPMELFAMHMEHCKKCRNAFNVKETLPCDDPKLFCAEGHRTFNI